VLPPHQLKISPRKPITPLAGKTPIPAAYGTAAAALSIDPVSRQICHTWGVQNRPYLCITWG
jgi:hypothetical protein